MAEGRTTPGLVRVAIALQIIGTLLSLAAAIFTTAAVNAGADQIWVMGVVVAIGLFFAQRISAGSRAVRLIMTVIAVVSIPLVIVDVFTGALGFTGLDVLAFAVWDIGVLLLWLPGAREHFLPNS